MSPPFDSIRDQLLMVTPPSAPVVQNAMSPPAVLTRLVDETSVPAVREIRPADLRVNPEFAVLLCTFDWTLIVPELSTKTVPEAMAATRSSFQMLAVSEEFDSNLPFTNEPLVGPEAVMLTIEATNVGVISTVVPTNASAESVRVWAPVTPD
jgi:hypothetical protein